MVLLEDNIQDVMNSYKKRIEVSSTSLWQRLGIFIYLFIFIS